MTWPADRSPSGPRRPIGLLLDDEQPELDAEPPGTFPVPHGRGRWRIGLHRRQFAPGPWQSTLITEIIGARGRRLELSWNAPAKFTFTLDGRHPSAALVEELRSDVYVWRWDDQTARDMLMFRGIVAQSEDQLTAGGADVVIFTCHDYLAMLGRRFFTEAYPATFANVDQDDIVAAFLAYRPTTSTGVGFDPGSYLPLTRALVHPNGSPRGLSGTRRDRSYTGGTVLGEALDNLANVVGGFDYDVLPAGGAGNQTDLLRIFWPYRGERRDIPLIYGSTVDGLTRSFNSGDYGNYWRVIGDNGGAEGAPQLFADYWNTDASHVPVGLWMGHDSAPDVNQYDTLVEKAQGDLDLAGQVVANWTLSLRPGAYSYGNPNLGDTVPLRVRAGRLDIDTEVRVIGLAYSIGQDGDEDVQVTVGRPRQTLGDYLTQSDRAVGALTRRSGLAEGVSAFPVGGMIDWAGPNLPDTTWRWCDGAPLVSTEYPELFAAIGHTFGGSGAVFNLPDMRGRMAIGTGQGDFLTNRPLGVAGGAETVSLIAANLPTHTHTVTPQQDYSIATVVGGVGPTGTYTFLIQSPPGGTTSHNHSGITGPGPGTATGHNNMPPFRGLGKIIRARPVPLLVRRSR